jgi:hypothetical protein
MRKWDHTLCQELEQLLTSGKTLQEVAEVFSCTKQNISLVIKSHLPHLRKTDFGSQKKAAIKREDRLTKVREAFGRSSWKWEDDLERAHFDFFRRKKQNCKSKKWGWDIQYTDLEYPKFCPILGLELNWFAEVRSEDSPSLGRLDSTKGYTPDNTIVMSWRANRIKNDGTLEEHQRIVEFLSKLQP